MSQLHVQPWGVLLISMTTNMTYESRGDIHLALPLSLSFSHFLHLGFTSSLGWAVDVRIKDTFACVDMATRGMLSRFSLAIMRSNISYTDWLKICSSELIRQYKYFLNILANHWGSTLPELYLHHFIPALVWHLQFEVGILDICCKIKTLRWKWRY